MARVGVGRRAFVEALVAVPFGGVAHSAQTASAPRKIVPNTQPILQRGTPVPSVEGKSQASPYRCSHISRP